VPGVTGTDPPSDQPSLVRPARPLQRLLAWLVDWLLILGWLVVVTLVGVPLYLSGARLSPVALNVVAALAGVVPVTVALALFEAGRRQATPGKRWRRLRVIRSSQGGRISVGQGLIRNIAKVGVPWTLGHVVAIALVSGATGTWVWVLTAITYALVIGYLVTLFMPGHRTAYDRLVGAAVFQSPD
jgi:uncharacterized RDD family membrane protein YckC